MRTDEVPAAGRPLRPHVRALRLILLASVLALSACGEDGSGTTSTDGAFTPAPAGGWITADPSRCAADPPTASGCARIIGAERLRAGTHDRFAIEFTVGPEGIAAGGGFAIGLHHAADWPVQSRAADAAGHVSLESADPGALELSIIDWAPAEMFAPSRPSFDSNSIFHKVLIARTRERTLAPGEIVRMRFGAETLGIEVLPYIDPEHEFRVTVDHDGDGRFEAIARSPRIAIEPDVAHEFAAFLPSQVAIGDAVTVRIRLEDATHNRIDDWQGTVTITDEAGRTLASEVRLQDGHGSAEVRLDEAGPQRLRIASTDGRLTGRSNPVRVYSELPELRLWWSDLHGHTSVSDGLGPDADTYFRFAREESWLDIVALTDHGHFDWPANIAAVKRYHAPGEFVTLLAQEAGAGPDHMNVYFRRDDAEHLSRWHHKYDELLAWVTRQYNGDRPEAMMAPHHYAYDRGFGGDANYPFGAMDEALVRFVEVYSSHGTSEYAGNPRPLVAPSDDHTKYLQHALEAGLRFGVIAASDNHDSHPGRSVWGRYVGGLGGIWASELTREAVWSALYDRRSYGTSRDRIYLDFRIDGQPMGSDIVRDGPVAIEAYVIGKHDGLLVELLRDNAVIASERSDDGHVHLTLEDVPGATTRHYYVRVTQTRLDGAAEATNADGGERAWSSPIWVSPGDPR